MRISLHVNNVFSSHFDWHSSSAIVTNLFDVTGKVPARPPPMHVVAGRSPRHRPASGSIARRIVAEGPRGLDVADGISRRRGDIATKSAINFNDDFPSMLRYRLSAVARSQSPLLKPPALLLKHPLGHTALETTVIVLSSRLLRRYRPQGMAHDCKTSADTE